MIDGNEFFRDENYELNFPNIQRKNKKNNLSNCIHSLILMP